MGNPHTQRRSTWLLLAGFAALLVPLLITWRSSPQAAHGSGELSSALSPNPGLGLPRPLMRNKAAVSSMATAGQGSWIAPVTPADGKPEKVMGANAPVASAHASTLVTTPNGGVLCAWFGGTRESADDVAILLSSRDPTGRWTPARVIANISNEAHWNPVLFWNPAPSQEDPNGVLWLHFKVGHYIPSWRTYVSTSTDHGASWAEPRELVPGDEGGRGCVKNKPLLLASGELIAGASLEDGEWRAFMDHSPDGVTWTAGKELETQGGHAGLIQPTLWQSSPTDVHALFRSDVGHVYRSDSTDGGREWGDAYSTKMPNNNSGIDVARLANGTLLLVLNPVEGNWGSRYPLRVAMSKDNGKTWSSYWDIETKPGEFSYPAIVPWEDPQKGLGFAMTYTWNRKDISFLSMSLQDLEPKMSVYAK